MAAHRQVRAVGEWRDRVRGAVEGCRIKRRLRLPPLQLAQDLPRVAKDVGAYLQHRRSPITAVKGVSNPGAIGGMISDRQPSPL